MIAKFGSSVFLLMLVLFSCDNNNEIPQSNTNTHFFMGPTIKPNQLDDADEVAPIKTHSNSFSAKNAMEWSSDLPFEITFGWANVGKIDNFSQANGMKVSGHILCRLQRVSSWFFKDGIANNQIWLYPYPFTKGMSNYLFLLGTGFNPTQAFSTTINI